MRIKELNIFPEKKASPKKINYLSLIKKEGIKGDAFCGDKHRQITLMSTEILEKIEKDKTQGICLSRYKFNILIEGINLSTVRIGDKLTLGESEIEITEKKECKITDCPLSKSSCPIRGLGVFAKVTKSGEVSVGDRIDNEPTLY